MSASQIVLDPSISPLIELGYEVAITKGHLMVLNVPYVDSNKLVRRGTLVCNLGTTICPMGPPPHHQAWFVGDVPCYASGMPMEGLISQRGPIHLWEGMVASVYFSNKPIGVSQFATYAQKMQHYIGLIEAQAGVIEHGVSAKTRKNYSYSKEAEVFKYEDMASVRAAIIAVTDKLRTEKIGLIGLGGTGSYILDLVSKTPVGEIHMYDGDQFETHNAFRAPGAASAEDLARKLSKVEYFAERYAPMRNGIVSHNCRITADNLQLLSELDFVFVAVDSGPSRRLICEYLQAVGIPFIDVGMDLQMNQESIGLHGMFRVTLSTPEQHKHFFESVPTFNDEGDDLYRSNIQVADMNMCNAAHAVICWKQYRSFYLEHRRSHHRVFTVFDQKLHLRVVASKEIE
ncbi:MAG TPA: ThiF family adenylyltransferase [Polaromonas sp.]|uniref:ThiF family adenylyltransferase n=1 Tax=Polaromonas sp. TaxID=1869339 RepID=UPI002D47DDA3|nr:ThiF family adenylyltransferase [Polaromonas sp.]HYW58503.1 ThiF family adenylyltransferase [Polaromonas sp.]